MAPTDLPFRRRYLKTKFSLVRWVIAGLASFFFFFREEVSTAINPTTAFKTQPCF
jgi:hypothetical protein